MYRKDNIRKDSQKLFNKLSEAISQLDDNEEAAGLQSQTIPQIASVRGRNSISERAAKSYIRELVDELQSREDRLITNIEILLQLVENIKEVFWMTNPDKENILYVSKGYEDIWGRTCKSLYDDPTSWMQAIHNEDRERVLTAATTKQVNGAYDETYRICRPDGTERTIRDRAFPILDNDGIAYRIVGLAEDITH